MNIITDIRSTGRTRLHPAHTMEHIIVKRLKIELQLKKNAVARNERVELFTAKRVHLINLKWK